MTVTKVYTIERSASEMKSFEARSNSTLKKRMLEMIRAIKGLMKKRQFTITNRQRATMSAP